MDDAKLAVIFALTFVIYLIGTLAYAVRIAGFRTRRVAQYCELPEALDRAKAPP